MTKQKTPDECKAELHLYLQQFGDVTTEFRFHPIRRWRFDYVLADRMLAVEFEGMNYQGGSAGGHRTIKGTEGDIEKYNTALAMGWRVFRTTTGQIRSGDIYVLLDQVLGQGEVGAA